MFKLLKHLKLKNNIYIIFCLLLTIVQVWLDLKMPEYMTNITRLVQTEGSKIQENVVNLYTVVINTANEKITKIYVNGELQEVIEQGFYMLSCAAVSLILAAMVGYLSANIASNFSYLLRNKIFNKVLDFSNTEIKKIKTSSLITRTTNDISQIEIIISMGLQIALKSPIMAIWAIFKIINKGIEWSILVAVCVIIMLILICTILSIVFPKFKKIQKLIDSLNDVSNENLLGIRVIRAFNAEKFQTNRFENINNDLTNTQLFNQRVFAFMTPIMNLIMNGLTLGIYVIGARLIQSAGLFNKLELFSNMVVFSNYGLQVISSFLMMAMIFMFWPRANISANRINEVLEQPLSIIDGTFEEKTNEEGTIEFKNVSFKYPDAEEYLIHNISFKINQGETVAFIGSTGSGKSSLINLIPRFYDVSEGEVLVDGINVKNYKQESLMNKIGYVSQKAIILTGTIKDNISYGTKNLTDEDIKKAIEIAQGKEFVENMENTYDSNISRGGTNISGGQKQRLSIARAIAKKPEILIFDDAFSALDYNTDLALRKAIKQNIQNITNIIVAQRIGTIINADKIIVLNNGECVGIGTHKELLNKCKVYKEIAYSQLSEEEMQNE